MQLVNPERDGTMVRTLTTDVGTLVPNNFHTVLVETVQENLMRFTVRQVALAEEAKRLYHKLGRPALKDYIQLVRTNGIKNCPITVDDINRAVTLWGTDLGSVLGRTIRKTPRS